MFLPPSCRRTAGRKLTFPVSCAAEDTNWGRELSSAVVRVGAGVLMVHNGLDKLADPEGFAKFVVCLLYTSDAATILLV